MRRVVRIALTLLLCSAALYAAVVLLLWWGQERLLFYPGTLPAEHRFRLPADVHETWVDVPGARLNALHLRLPQPRGVVFFLHGNAGNLESWFTGLAFYRQANFDLFMIDYRGYGKSSGRIQSEAQLLADVHAAWDHMASLYAGRVHPTVQPGSQPAASPGAQPFKRVIYGRSLGTGPAAMLAAELQPELTILVSPYASMGALAQQHFRWVPALALRYPLHTETALARVKTPVVLAHGGHDTLVPPVNSQRLLAVARQARLILVPEAGHNDIQQFEAVLGGLRAALDGL